MKKELLKFINSEEDESYFRLNAISYLRHRTKSPLTEKKIDVIEIEFDQIYGIYCNICNKTITSRDFEGILLECQEKTDEFLKEVNYILCREIKAGHNGYEYSEFKEAHNTVSAPLWLRELLKKEENKTNK